jgi:hypothetical protein
MIRNQIYGVTALKETSYLAGYLVVRSLDGLIEQALLSSTNILGWKLYKQLIYKSKNIVILPMLN